MAVKYYAVRTGKKPGVYMKWEECKAMVHGFPGAVYKSFPTRAQAEKFVQGDAEGQQSERTESLPENYAFVDGSYNAPKKIYGYGGFLMHGGVKEVLQGAGEDAEMASMRNVAGEVNMWTRMRCPSRSSVCATSWRKLPPSRSI